MDRIAAMNAFMAYHLWHHKHRTGEAIVWTAVSLICVIVAAAAMGGSPPGFPLSIRNAVNWATGPVIYSVGTTAILVFAYLFRRWLVRPMVGWSLLVGSLVLMGVAMVDMNFSAIVMKPDNVPIVGLVFLLGSGVGPRARTQW